MQNGIYYYFNHADGTIDVISRSGKWKIIVNGQKHFIWLYHKNTNGSEMRGLVPGYHSQSVRRSTLMGYMRYIKGHDEYRENDPLYNYQKHSGVSKRSKNWGNDQRRAERIRRTQSIRYVVELLENRALGNITY